MATLSVLTATLDFAVPARAGTAPPATTTYTATADIPVPPASAYAGSGGGDGWGLAFTDTQVFNVFHHQSSLQLACHEQSDASPCFSPETIVDSNGNGFATSGQPGLYLDRANGELFVFATRTSDGTGGVVCIDTAAAAQTTDPFCGFTALTAVGAAPVQGSISAISDPVQVGEKWFAYNYVNGGQTNSGGENSLLCFDLSAFAACAQQPFPVSVPAGTVGAGDFPPPAVAALGTEVLVPLTVNGIDQIACFDGAALAACGGSWPLALAFPYDSSYGTAFPLLDSTGVLQGFCLPTGTDPCYSLAGTPTATPAGLTAVIPNTSGWNGPALTLGPRVYVPNGDTDSVDCFDYSTGGSCTNFPKQLANLGLLYTVDPDPQRPTCIWVNSDDGSSQIQNFDAYTGGACGQGPVRVLASFLVAPGSLCVPTSYQSLAVLSPPPSAYTSGSVSFEDGDGNPIPGTTAVALDGTGTASLAGQSLNTASGLPQFLITLAGTQATPSDVQVRLTWTGAADPSCTPPSEIGEGGWVPTSTVPSLLGPDSNAGMVNDPVNVSIGNFVDQQTDLTYPSTVFGMQWGRTYNSRNASSGPLGLGWSESLVESLASGADGSLVLTEGSGRQDLLPPAAGGGWGPASGQTATVSANATGGWTLSDPSTGESDVFSAAGQLSSRTDSEGDTVTYSYSAGQLASVQSSQGASFALGYDAQGLLTSVTSGDGRSISYTYGPSGFLQSEVGPTGAVTTYDTDTAGRVVALVDPDGNTTVQNTYDALGRVLSQTAASGRVTDFAYNDSAGTTQVTDVASGSASLFTYGRDGLVTAATDPSGHTATITYGANGQATGVVERNGATAAEAYTPAGLPATSTDADGNVTHYAYDASGRVTSVTDPTGAQTTYTYQGTAREPVSITDPDGNVTTQTIVAGRVASVTDADGVKTSYTYNQFGQTTSVVTAAGVQTSTYDAAGDLIASADADGSTTKNTYDAAGELLSSVDPLGGATTYTYDADGRQLTVTGPTGGTTTNTYDSAGDLVKTVNPLGQATLYTYDAFGNLVSETGPNGITTPAGTYDPLGDQTSSTDPGTGSVSYTFDANGNVTSQTDASGATTTYQLDPAGRVLQTTDGTGRSTSYRYDADGRMLAVTRPDAAVTSQAFDLAGRLLSSTDASGGTTTYRYTPGGRQSEVTDPLGQKTVYAYDAAGREVSITSPSGAVTAVGYDADGRTTSITEPGGLVERFTYDADGRETSAVAPGGEVTRATYDAAGDRTSVTSPTGGTARYAYDPAGELVSATDALGATTTYGYDAEGNVTSVTDARGGVEHLTYSSANQLLGVTDQLGRTTTYTYDALGRVASVTDPAGRVEQRTYDADGELVGDSWSQAGQPTIAVTSSFNPDGQLVSSAGPAGTTSYAYDTDGRLVSVGLPGGGALAYGYNADGQLTGLTYPDGTKAAYTYTPDGKLASASLGSAVTSYTYNAAGELTRSATPGGGGRTWTYVAGQLTGYSQTINGQTHTTAVTTDAAGDVTGERTSAGSASYTYDRAGQLTSESFPVPGLGNVTVTYTYDANGNRVGAAAGGLKATYTYDAANELTSVSGPQLGEASLTTSYQYDASGRQTAQTNALGAVTTSYNSRGEAVRKVVTAPWGTTLLSQQLGYDGAGNLASISTSPILGAPSSETLTWSQGAVPEPLAQTSGTGSATHSSDFLYGNQREEVAQSGSVSPFAYDANGSALTTPATAPFVQAAEYSAFGASAPSALGALAGVAGLLFPQSPLGASATSFGYRGELQLDGQVDLRARTYDPLTGRFTSPDPLPGTPGTVLAANAYPYAANDPLDETDPAGQHPIDQQDFNFTLANSVLPAAPGGPSVPTYTQSAATGGFGPQLPYVCTIFPQSVVPCLPTLLRQSSVQAEATVALANNALPDHLYTPVPGFIGGRFIDVYAYASQQAIEVKTGSQSYSGNIVTQVAKDGVLRANGATFNTPSESLAGGVNWEFWPNLAGTTQPTAPLVDALLAQSLGVTVYYYDPLAQPQPQPNPLPVPLPAPDPMPVPAPAPQPVPVPSGGHGGGGGGVPVPVLVGGGAVVIAGAACVAFIEVCGPALIGDGIGSAIGGLLGAL